MKFRRKCSCVGIKAKRHTDVKDEYFLIIDKDVVHL